MASMNVRFVNGPTPYSITLNGADAYVIEDLLAEIKKGLSLEVTTDRVRINGSSVTYRQPLHEGDTVELIKKSGDAGQK